MAQVRVAPRTGNSNAFHPEGIVFNELHVFFRDRRPEAGPARAGLEFCLGIKQRRAAAGAAEDPSVVQVPVLAGKRALRAFMASDLKDLLCKLLLPLLVALHHFCHGGAALACS